MSHLIMHFMLTTQWQNRLFTVLCYSLCICHLKLIGFEIHIIYWFNIRTQ